MGIDVQITDGLNGEIETTMTTKLIEHVVIERNAG